MTSEQRLDRLERIAKLLVKAGLRARSDFRQKIEILIDAQMRNEARFALLAESQIHTDRRLDVLIDIIRQGRNGDSRSNSV